MDYQQSSDESNVYTSDLSLYDLYSSSSQERLPDADLIKTNDIVEEDAILKEDLNAFENEIQASVLAANFYQLQADASINAQKRDPLCLDIPLPVDSLQDDFVPAQEKKIDVLSENVVKKSLHSSKVFTPCTDGLGDVSSINVLDSLQITTGISGKPYSYAQLITYALATSSTQKMTLSELYKWCMDNFPYFKEAPSQGWKNSIRHNLSLNRNFVRIPRPINEPGKGSYWTLNKSRLNGIKISNKMKNSERTRGPSSSITLNHIIKLNRKNGATSQLHKRSSCSSKKTSETLSQSSINPFATELTSLSPSLQVLHSYVVQHDPLFYKYLDSTFLPPQSQNITQCNIDQQANLLSCLDSTYGVEDNKNQEFLSNVLKFQPVKPQIYATSMEPDAGTYLDQQLFLHQPDL